MHDQGEVEAPLVPNPGFIARAHLEFVPPRRQPGILGTSLRARLDPLRVEILQAMAEMDILRRIEAQGGESKLEFAVAGCKFQRLPGGRQIPYFHAARHAQRETAVPQGHALIVHFGFLQPHRGRHRIVADFVGLHLQQSVARYEPKLSLSRRKLAEEWQRREANLRRLDATNQVVVQAKADEARDLELRKKTTEPVVLAELAPFITLVYAQCLRALAEEHFPQAEKIVLVQDNLNTHAAASLYEAFEPVTARRFLDRFEFHYTPKHGSWLNIAEIELSGLSRQCLDRRIGEWNLLRQGVTAWTVRRNQPQCKINWRFTTADARIKLKKLYPSFDA